MSLILIQNHLASLKIVPNDITTRPDCIFYGNEHIDEIVSKINKNTNKLVFIYDTNKTNNVPFFTHNIGEYFYFSNDIITLFDYTKNLSGLLNVILITNNVDNKYFINEMKKIEHNLNITIELKNLSSYNFENIPKYLPTIPEPIPNIEEIDSKPLDKLPANEITIKAPNPVTLDKLPVKYFKTTKNANGGYNCILLSNINLSILKWSDSNSFISLNNYDLFDGSNNTITVSWLNEGIFQSVGNAKLKTPIIQNLNVQSNNNISGGAIVRNNASYIQVNNCTVTGVLTNNSGGICGINAGKNGICNISNCKINCDISGNNSGGICSSLAGNNGICTIDKCIVNSNINGFNNGGICSYGAGIDNGQCIITNCQYNGIISGNNNGGICSSLAGNNGSCTIINCTTKGKINGKINGGICSSGYGIDGVCDISGCTVISNMTGNENGGICSTLVNNNIISANSGYSSITYCTYIGDISGNYNGGICSTNAGSSSYCIINNCNVQCNIIGRGNSGVCGAQAGNYNGNCNILNCSVTIKSIGNKNSGICGSNAANIYGKCTITNCNTKGNMTGNYNSGICNEDSGSDDGNCIINNCIYNGNIYGNYNSGICGINSICNIMNSSYIGDISGNYNSGIYGGNRFNKDPSNNFIDENTKIDYSGDIYCEIINCNSKGTVIGNNNGGISCLIAGNKNNIIITNCYSKNTFIGKYNSTLISYIKQNNGIIIENCYNINIDINVPLINLIMDSSLIISNSYTTSFNVINNCINSNIYIFNSYCRVKFINNINNSLIYLNNVFDTTNNLSSSLSQITNRLNTNSQISNIGYIDLNGYIFSPTIWNTINIWNTPSASTTDTDTYPTLKTNP